MMTMALLRSEDENNPQVNTGRFLLFFSSDKQSNMIILYLCNTNSTAQQGQLLHLLIIFTFFAGGDNSRFWSVGGWGEF